MCLYSKLSEFPNEIKKSFTGFKVVEHKIDGSFAPQFYNQSRGIDIRFHLGETTEAKEPKDGPFLFTDYTREPYPYGFHFFLNVRDAFRHLGPSILLMKVLLCEFSMVETIGMEFFWPEYIQVGVAKKLKAIKVLRYEEMLVNK